MHGTFLFSNLLSHDLVVTDFEIIFTLAVHPVLPGIKWISFFNFTDLFTSYSTVSGRSWT